MPRLITIPVSHYCERARWALEHAGIEFHEDPHLQFFSGRQARRAGGTMTVPVLATDSEVLADSADILAYADARAAPERRLYPEDAAARAEIVELERPLADVFGVETRRMMYAYVFEWGRPALPYNTATAPRWQGWLLQVGFPLVKVALRHHLEISDESTAQAREVVEATFDEIGAQLADGRPYLFGDRFTALDLTFACMAAAVLMPEGYAVPLPRPEAFPAGFREIVQGYRAHPAGQHALRMFAEHRR